MANSDKDILITPNSGSSTADPKIEYVGADSSGNDTITVETLYDGTKATLSFEGSAGQLFSVVNDLSSDPIFSVNDVSGIPSIEVDSDGEVRIAEFSGNVGIGTSSPSSLLDVDGRITANNLTLQNLSAQNSEATAVMIDGSGIIGTRELGSNAFNSTTIPTNNNQLTNGAGYTTNTGTVTQVSGTSPISVGNGTTTPAITFSSSAITTSTSNADGDFFLVHSGTTSSGSLKKLTKANINISGFNNDSGYITSSNSAITNKLPLAGGTMSGNINLNGSNLTGINYLQFENEEVTTFSAAYQMVVDANDTDTNVPNHGNTSGSGPFGIYFTGDGGNSTTTLGSGLVKVWHTGHFTKDHIDYFVGLYNTGVTTTEFDYLDGVTSNIQTQLNSKLTGITSSQVTTALGYTPYQESTALSATTGDFSETLTVDSANYAILDEGSLGWSYSPQESSSANIRYFLMFNYTNNGSYPFLTNRTPSGRVSIYAGTAAGGGENEKIRVNGGDGTTQIDMFGTLDMNSNNITSVGTISSGQINTTTGADATPAIIATNTGGVGSTIQRWVGDAASLEVKNFSGSDYKISNSQQDNAIAFYNVSGGVEIFYNGSAVQEWDSSGGTNLISGSFKVGGTAVIDSSRNLTNIGTISSGAITAGGDVLPSANDTYDLGSTAAAWKELHVEDIRFHNASGAVGGIGQYLTGGDIEILSDHNIVFKETDAGTIKAVFGMNGPNFTFGQTTENTSYRVYSNGSIASSADVIAYASDERLKTNIVKIDSAIEKVKQLRGVTFDWQDDVEEKGFEPAAKHETGVIAQEVQKVIPDAVVPAPFDPDYLTVKHEKIIPVLIEAIKEQQETIEKLTSRINEIEKGE